MATLSVGGTTVYNGTTLDNGAFPAGHVINTISASFAGNSNTEAGTTAWTDTGISLDVTAGQWSGGSKIYVMGSGGFSYSGSYLHYKLERTAPSAVDLCIYTFGTNHSGDWNREGFNLCGLDSSLGVGTHTYKVRFYRENGTVYYMGSDATVWKFLITAMVIK